MPPKKDCPFWSGKNIWQMDPVCIVSLLGVCLKTAEIRNIIRRFDVRCCEDCLSKDGVLLKFASQVCRTENRVSRAVERLLLSQYADYILEIGFATTGAVKQLAGSEHYMQENLPGVLCALCYSRDEEKSSMGEHLAYVSLACGFGQLASGVNARPGLPPSAADLAFDHLDDLHQRLN